MPLFGKPDTAERPSIPTKTPEPTGTLQETHEQHERALEIQKYLDGAAKKLIEQGSYYEAVSAIIALGEPQDLAKHANTLRELKDHLGPLAVKRGEFAEAASKVLQGLPPDQQIENFDPQILTILELPQNYWATYREAQQELKTRLQLAENNGAAAVEALSQKDNSVTTVKLGSFELPLPEAATSTPDLFSKIRSAWREQTARPVPPTPTPDTITPHSEPTPTPVIESPIEAQVTPPPSSTPSPTPELVPSSGSNAF